MQPIQEQKEKEIIIKIGEHEIPATKRRELATQHVPMDIIKELHLGKRLSRKDRRKLAKDNKMDWNIYQLLTREIHRRMFLRLNLETGKKEGIIIDDEIK